MPSFLPSFMSIVSHAWVAKTYPHYADFVTVFVAKMGASSLSLQPSQTASFGETFGHFQAISVLCVLGMLLALVIDGSAAI